MARPRLTRDAVLQRAVALADGTGIEATSMRALAQELGVTPMALYKHVAARDELLDGMVDLVWAEVEPPSGPTWRAAIRARAVSLRAALRRHPWAIGLMEARMRPGPANLRAHDAMMGCLREAGFPFRSPVHVPSALDAYVYGFALQERTLPFETPEESGDAAAAHLDATPPAEAVLYPHLLEVVVELARAGYDYDEEFATGLDLILDGVEAAPWYRARGSREA